MTPREDSFHPPRAAAWLVNLFAPSEDAESILGDLLEEFSTLASKTGVTFARSWYWRQAIRTVGHLAGTGLRAAPWSIAAAVAGGFLMIRVVGRLPQAATTAVLERYRVFEHDPDAYIFWLKAGFLMGQFIVAALVGSFVAAAAKGKEMTATMTLVILRSALAVASVLVVGGTGDSGHLWTLPWSFAFSIATVVGGAIVRECRSATATRPSAA